MLLQSYDFAHLHRTMGVELQMGGADQWGNITAGLELIRRTERRGRGGRTGGGRSGPRARLQAAALAVGHEVRQERGAASRSGSTRRGPRRTRSTSTGSTPTTATSGPTCAGSPSCSRERDRGARGRDGARARGAGRPSGRSRSTSRPGRTARRRRPAAIADSAAKFSARADRRPGRPRLAVRRRPAGSRSIRRGSAPGVAVAAGRGRRVRVEGRGAADDRGRRRDDQRRSG